jgi:hypothetical protein
MALIVAKPRNHGKNSTHILYWTWFRSWINQKKTSNHGLFLNKETEFNEYRK